MKKRNLITLGLLATGLTANAEVLITEYVEGSSNNKAIELTNLGSTTINLATDAYRISLYGNGATEARGFLDLTQTLAPNQSLIIYNSGAAEEFKSDTGVASSVTYFNGDDALVLTKGDQIVDSLGQVGTDPGSEWTDPNDPNFSTKEKTIRRLASVTTGDIIIDDVFPGATNQWATFPQNTADGLGCPGVDACPGPEGILITEYVEGSSNNKAIELSNIGKNDIDLQGEGYSISIYTNGSDTASYTEQLNGTLAGESSLVIYNNSASDAFKFDAPKGLSSSVAGYNGDDAIVLHKGDEVVDSFGQVGVDPGSEWKDDNDADFSSKDKTLRRLASVIEGDKVIDDAFPGSTNQWVVFDKDTSNGLSCAGVDACPVDPDDNSGGDTSEPPVAVENSIIITEYIEGSSNNKALEISNLGSTNVDLKADKYRLESFNNGGTDVSYGLDLYGILPPNASLVVYNNGATAEFKKDAPQGIASNVTYFNGDDAIVLSKGGVPVDSLGRKGEDPGSSWSDANNASFATANKTLRRLNSVTVGDNIVDDAFPGATNQWAVFDQNTSDGLGCHGEAACTGNEPQVIADPNAPDPGTPTTPDNGGSVCLNCPEVTKVADASKFIDSDYYAEALQADDANLHTSINKIISANQKKLSYSEVWTVLTHSDEDPANKDNVILLYTGKSIPKALNGSGSQASNQDAWNREHVWSKSHGFPSTSQYGYTDAHHLRPADVSINSTRSNYDFAEGGSPVSESPINYYDTSLRTWQPREAVRGDVARMMFYMDVRYDGASADNNPDLILVDKIGTENGSPTFGKLCTLYSWHLTDPVDSLEQQRNNAVYEFQGNRNPFIDHPEWITRLWGSACGDSNTAPVAKVTGDFDVYEEDKVNLDASGSTDAQNDNLTYSWRQVSGPTVAISSTSAQLTFLAPVVTTYTELVLEVSVSDGQLTTTKQFTVKVRDEEEESLAGSAGQFLIGFLVLMMFGRRVKA